MRVTPLDIRKQEFKKTMRGLDSDEVYAFLNTVAEEYEIVLSDNKRLREHVVELEERIKEYKGMEDNLRNTLLTAERVTAEAKENARREAGLLIREAEVEAEKAAETIRAHTQQLRKEILELKKQKDNYINRLKTLLESHSRVVEGFEEDFSHVDEEIERIGRKVEEDIKKATPAKRMSRDKITEDFAHGPSDKVTWGDDKKREDKARPEFPSPEWQGEKGPGKGGSRPEDSDAGTGEEEVVAPLETEPIGAVDDLTAAEKAIKLDTSQEEMFMDGEPNGAAVEEDDDDWQDDAASQDVQKSIEEKMYPDIHVGENADLEDAAQAVSEVEIPIGEESADLKSDTPAAAGVKGAPQASGAQPQPAPQPREGTAAGTIEPDARPGQASEFLPQSDDWKGYEVRGEKQDWKDYSVPNSEAPPKKKSKDNEVEQALSGLTEVADNPLPPAQEGQAPAPGTQDATKASPQPPAAAKKGAPKPPKQAASKQGDDAPWSMEELRKNLSNLNQNEGNKEKK